MKIMSIMINEFYGCYDCCFCYEDSIEGFICICPDSKVSHDEVFDAWDEHSFPKTCPFNNNEALLICHVQKS